MLSKIVFVLGVTVIGSAIAQVKQCQLKGEWGPSCQDQEMICMDDDMKSAILNMHNQLRNDIALGKIEHYDQVANMATMQWDETLAQQAALNVHQCAMVHDECAKSDEFPHAGQNLAMSFTTEEAEKSPEQVANLLKRQWFDKEQVNGGAYGWMDMINKFTTAGQANYVVGHFTQLIWASANKIGCAVSTSKTFRNDRDQNTTWLACNYSYGNMINEAVYKSGGAASGCSTGKNSDYEGLCSTDETYECIRINVIVSRETQSATTILIKNEQKIISSTTVQTVKH